MSICTIVLLLLGIYVTIDLALSAYVVGRIGGLRAAIERIRSNWS